MQPQNQKQNELAGPQSWADSNGYSHAGIAILWLIAAFILFQAVGLLFSFLLVIINVAMLPGSFSAQQISQFASQHIGLVFWGNSVGELVGLALATWVFCRVQANKTNRPSFLRFQSFDNTLKMAGIAFALIIVIQPVIWFVAWLNSLIPMPHFMHSLQSQRMGEIKNYLGGKGHLGVILFNVALIPAFCEEILFRGYALRSFQKSWGPVAAMIITGLIFGLYHMEPSNFLPLAGIGILLAYITWVTQSIFPAMVAHFVNNATSIILVKFYPDTGIASTAAVKTPPMSLFIISILVSAFLLYLLAKNKMNPKRSPMP